MHKMHEVARGKRKEPATGQPKKQQQQKQKEPKRTGLDEEQQRRIAARAAKAMEKQVRRRRDRRSQFVWGDRKKAVIKRYPDGTQEILVPQNLTPEQEHYEFPPRSRLLKKLASATAERRRMSFLQQPDYDTNDPPNPLLPPPTIQPSVPLSPPQPDQNAMAEWFSSRKPDNSKHQQQKERQVIEWIRDLENSKTPKKKPITSSSSSSSAPKKQQPQPPVTRSPLLLFDHAPIQFKSKAGKRWAQSSGYAQSPSSPLAPPPEEDSARRHYVPRNLLRRAGARPREQDDAATRIQATWRGYSCRHHQSNVTGMVKLVGMFHKALEQQQRLAQERLHQLESLLQEERRQRERSEQKHKSSWSRLEELQARLDKHPDMSSLIERVSALENSVSKESLARAQLENSVSAAMQYMSTLETSIKGDKARAEQSAKRRPRSVATTTRVSRQPQ
ncbi:hypothetical protein BJV82DRAFT_213616 [Fennellomyces sp. T-0311]|nr:hypothetical protein BJV82DRAFT_213616 [Fennellomyces sp. T-0311]